MIQSFYTMFGDDNPIEKENSCMSMSTMWDGFSYDTLCKRIEDRCAYAAFIDVALTNAEAIDTRVAVIIRTGLYTAVYELWLDLPATQRTTATQSFIW